MSAVGPECLYYSHPGLDESEAALVEIDATRREIVLDRTLFFPEGGGQGCDLGLIGGVAVESVVESGGRIVHRLASPLEAGPGDRLALRLDRARRRDQSEQHSAQHLLSGYLFRNHGIPTLSFHLGGALSTIDVDLRDFPDSLVEELDSEVNGAIARATPFVLHLCPPEDIETLPLRRPPPGEEEVLRVWEIVGLDFSPCCGTHVESAAELRLFKIDTTERYKGKTRIHFVAGDRAVAMYRRLHRAAGAASRILSAPPEALDEGAERCAKKSREAAARADRLLGILVGRLVDAAPLGRPLALDLSGAGVEGIDEGMRAIKAREMTGVVSLAETPTIGIVGKRGESLPPELLAAAKTLGGKGGGAPGSLRMAFPDPVAAAKFAALALGILENR